MDNPECEYCQTRNNDLLVKCIDVNCNRWFCNLGKVPQMNGSHIMIHLKIASHRKIALHPGNRQKLGDIKCAYCGNFIIYNLSLDLRNSNIVCIDCWRDHIQTPSSQIKSFVKENTLDSSIFHPHIAKNRYKVSATRNEIERKESKYINKSENKSLADLEYMRIQKSYRDLIEYKSLMRKLLKLNSEEEKVLHKKNQINNIPFTLMNDFCSGFFKGTSFGCKFTERDKLIISTPSLHKWAANGCITKIESGNYYIAFTPRAPTQFKLVNIHVDYDDMITKKVLTGLSDMNVGSLCPNLLQIFLGQQTHFPLDYIYERTDYSINVKRPLNSSQNKAVKNAFLYKCSIIQGPPGTGKTETILCIVYHTVNLWRGSLEYTTKKNAREKLINAHTKGIEEMKKALDEDKAKLVNIKVKVNSIITNIRDNINLQIRNMQYKIQHFKGEQNKNLEFLRVNSLNDAFRVSMQVKLQKISENARLNSIISNLENHLNMQVTKSTQALRQIGKRTLQEVIPLLKPVKINPLNSDQNFKSVHESLKPIPNEDLSARIHNTFNSSHKILVCAASNTAVSLLKNRLVDLEIKVIQIYAKYKENASLNDPHSLHHKLNSDPEYLSMNNSLEQEIQLEQNKLKSLDKNDPNYDYFFTKINENIDSCKKRLQFNNIKSSVSVLEPYEVICCTCLTTKLSILKNFKFEHVIFDEATQALEAESILCISKGAQRLVLVGDLNQLGSVVQSPNAKALGLDVPLIERLIDIGVPTTMLAFQYRMHPSISKFPNMNFYNGQLIDGVNAKDRTHRFRFPRPLQQAVSFFYDITSDEEQLGSATSYLNRSEAEAIKQILQYMLSKRLKGQDIGIITFYDGQKGLLLNYLNKGLPHHFISEIEIMSVDASQGKEKDFIILSCVRANMNVGIGFLDDFRRLNVALTRAKYGMIICGQIETLLTSNIWSRLLAFYAEKQLIFNGVFTNMHPVDIQVGLDEHSIERQKKYKKNS